jgi:hypothetical protein
MISLDFSSDLAVCPSTTTGLSLCMTLTLTMITAMFAETLEGLQQMT